MRKPLVIVCLTVLFAVLFTSPASAQTGGGNGSGPVLCGFIHTPRTDEPPCTEPPQANGFIHTPKPEEPDSTTETLLDMLLSIIGL